MNLGILSLLSRVVGPAEGKADAGAPDAVDAGAAPNPFESLIANAAADSGNGQGVSKREFGTKLAVVKPLVAVTDLAATDTLPLTDIIVPEVPVTQVATDVVPDVAQQALAQNDGVELTLPLPVLVAPEDEKKDGAILNDAPVQTENAVTLDFIGPVLPKAEDAVPVPEPVLEQNPEVQDVQQWAQEHAKDVVPVVAVPVPLPVAIDVVAEPEVQASAVVAGSQTGNQLPPVLDAQDDVDADAEIGALVPDADVVVAKDVSLANVAPKAEQVAQRAAAPVVVASKEIIEKNLPDAKAPATSHWHLLKREKEEESTDLDDAQLEAVVARLLQGRADEKQSAALQPAAQNYAPATPVAGGTSPLDATLVVDDASGGGDEQTLSALSNQALGSSGLSAEVSHRGNGISNAARAEHFASLLNHPAPSEQVQVSIKKAISLGMDRMTIQMNPEELGRVEVRMDVGADGRSSVIFTADKSETLQMLQRDAAQLERVLQGAGINAGASDMQFNLHQRQAQTEQGGDQGGNGRYAAPQADAAKNENAAYVDAVTGNYTITVNSGLDIRV